LVPISNKTSADDDKRDEIDEDRINERAHKLLLY
jgi:hypothetical protein